MKRRDVIAGLTALTLARPARAEPLIPLHPTPRRLLSPPFVDGKGREMTLDAFRGRVVLLNIWATWCVPCREEMPTLDRLQATLGGDGFHVLPLSIDRAGMKPVRRFYRQIGLTNLGMYLADSTRAMFALGITGLPTTILIGRDGQELGRLVGPAEWDSPGVTAQLRSYL